MARKHIDIRFIKNPYRKTGMNKDLTYGKS